MDPITLAKWINAASSLVAGGIMLEKEFAEIFKSFNRDMTPEQQHEALMKIRDEAGLRKARAEAEVAATEAKIATETPPTPDE